MTYQETLAYIYGLGRFGMRPGLEKITAILRALGNPQNSIKTVHVAGTNGKGSTAAFLASILAAGGYRTGLFTSPHLTSFTERIRINGDEIGEDEVVCLAEKVMVAAPPGSTFFELVTAMALLHFARRGVDIVILETGMGGRFDATNAVSGIVSIITPVSLDHCEHLGRTVAEIAGEKAGVIKSGRPAVISAQSPEALEIIVRRCEELGSPLYSYGKSFAAEWERDGLSYRGLSIAFDGIKPGISGRYQSVNAATALCAAELLAGAGFRLDAAALRRGLETACWPGRMELLEGFPRVILDCAHNPAGGEALAEALGDIPRNRLFLVAGVMADKDADGILAPLLSLAEHVFAVSPALDRALPSALLAGLCRGKGVACTDAGNVAAGLALAKRAAEARDLILVCGSLFTVGEARAQLVGRHFEPFRG